MRSSRWRKALKVPSFSLSLPTASAISARSLSMSADLSCSAVALTFSTSALHCMDTTLYSFCKCCRVNELRSSAALHARCSTSTPFVSFSSGIELVASSKSCGDTTSSRKNLTNSPRSASALVTRSVSWVRIIVSPLTLLFIFCRISSNSSLLTSSGFRAANGVDAEAVALVAV